MAYSFYNTCIPVSGFIRSAIYDFQLNDFYFTLKDINKVLKRMVDEDIISTLIEKRTVFFDAVKDRTLKNNFEQEFDYPAHITNAIIELDSIENIKYIFKLLEILNCYNVQFVFSEGTSEELLLQSCHQEITNSIIKHCEIILPYSSFIRNKDWMNFENFPELGLLIIYNAPETYFKHEDKQQPSIFFHSEKYSYADHQNKKSKHLFSVNSLLYAESLKYNNYYHRKLFISQTGDIKNGPLVNKTYGNLYEKDFNPNAVVEDAEFQELGRIRKDEINVCHVCEFRYMCVDSRIPVKHLKENRWYHTDECNYNPFIAKWEHEKDYKPLIESGVYVKRDKMEIDYNRLSEVIEGLYLRI